MARMTNGEKSFSAAANIVRHELRAVIIFLARLFRYWAR